MASRDIDLVIRAKDDAKRVIDSINQSLAALSRTQTDAADSAQNTGSQLAAMAARLDQLSTNVEALTAFQKVVRNIESATAALHRLQSESDNTKASLGKQVAELQTQSEATRTASAESQRLADVYHLQQAATAKQGESVQALSAQIEALGRGYTKLIQEVKKSGDPTDAQAQSIRDTRDALISLIEKETQYKEQLASEKRALAEIAKERAAADSNLKNAESAQASLQKAVERTSAAYEQLKHDVNAAEKALAEIKGAGGEIAVKLNVSEASSKDISESIKRAKLDRDDLIKTIREQKAVEEEEVRTAQRIKDALDPLGAVERERAKEVANLTRLQERSLLTQDEYQRQLSAINIKAEQSTRAIIEKAKATDEETVAAARRTQATTEEARAVQRLMDAIDPTAAVQRNLNAQVAEAERLYKAGAIDATSYAKALSTFEAQAKRATNEIARGQRSNKKGFLGLSGSELNNLSFQLNDVFTQLASGTSITQTFAQQGGQIFQVFQGSLGEAAAGLGEVAALTVGVGAAVLLLAAPFAIAAKNIGDLTESAQRFDAQLTSLGENSDNLAPKLAEVAHQLDVQGGSLEDARAAVSKFLAAGVTAPDQVREFGKAAQDLAEVMGGKLPDAADKISRAFTGTMDDIERLNAQFHFLTAADKETAQQMFDSGRAVDARRFAFQKFADQQEVAAQKMRGPWSQALRNFAQAWDNFLSSIAKSDFVQALIKGWDGLGQSIANATAELAGYNQQAAKVDVAKVRAALNPASVAPTAVDSRVPLLLRAPGSAGAPASGFSSTIGSILSGIDQTQAQPKYKLPSEVAIPQESRAQQDAFSRATKLAKEELDSAKGLSREQRVQVELRKLQNEAYKDGNIQLSESETRELKLQAAAIVDAQIAKETAGQRKSAAKAAETEAQRIERVLQELDNQALKDEGQTRQAFINAALLKAKVSELSAAGKQITAKAGAVFDQNQKKILTDAVEALHETLGLNQQITEEEFIQKTALAAHIDLTNKENAAISQQVATYKDLLSQEFQRQQLQRKVDDISTTTTELEQQLELQKQLGNDDAVKALTDRIRVLRAQYVSLIDVQLAVARNKLETSNVDKEATTAEIERLTTLKLSVQAIGDETAKIGAQIRDAVLNQAVSAWDELTQSINENHKVFKDLSDTVRKFASQFLLDIAKMIVQQTIFNALNRNAVAPNAQSKVVPNIIAGIGRAFGVGGKKQNTGAGTVATSGAVTTGSAPTATQGGASNGIANTVSGGLSQVLLGAFGLGGSGAGGIPVPLPVIIVGGLGPGGGATFPGGGFPTVAGAPGETLPGAGSDGGAPQQKGFFASFFEGAQKIFGSIFDFVKGGFTDVFAVVTKVGGDVFRGAGQILSGLFQNLGGLLSNLLSGIGSILGGAGGGIGSLLGSIASGAGGFASGIGGFLASIFHEGGVAGSGSSFRVVDPRVFEHATRYHIGGVSGLRPGEIPAVLQEGETIRTAAQEEDLQRQMAASSGGGAAPTKGPSVKIVNVFDPADMLEKGLGSPRGERVIINFVRGNKRGVNAALGAGAKS